MPQSILEVVRELIDSPEAKSAYADDPSGFMAARGLDALTSAELEEAVGFVAETMPAPVARQLQLPPDPAVDSLPLARVAAATVVEAAVIEAEPGTVDVTALVDPSGQLDLVTDGVATPEGPAAHAAPADREDVNVVEEEEVETDVDGAVDDDGGFGTGAPVDEEDATETELTPPMDEVDEADDEVDLAPDDTALRQEDTSFELDDDAPLPESAPSTVSDTDDQPPEDDIEDVII